jgi:hypothetical protein
MDIIINFITNHLRPTKSFILEGTMTVFTLLKGPLIKTNRNISLMNTSINKDFNIYLTFPNQITVWYNLFRSIPRDWIGSFGRGY